MNIEIIIRNETEADVGAIAEVTIAAFNTLEISNHTEQFIINGLRASGALSISLVAEVNDSVIGHIAFSPITLSGGTPGWYGLGPLSVLPDHQRKGVGTALVQAGLAKLRDSAQGCCLVGHPEYYKRFGFRNVPTLIYEGVPPEVFLSLSFDEHTPQGKVTFHEAFNLDSNASADSR